MITAMPVSPLLHEFDAAVLSVWKQSLIEESHNVSLHGVTYPIRRTAKHKLVQVDFELGGEPLRGLEQNPQTASRWAQLARKGGKVMRFLSAGEYLAVVSDGKI